MNTENKINKIFCVAPFVAMRIEAGKFGVTYKPGCVYVPVNKIDSLDEFLHGYEMSSHRDNLCNGTTPSVGCHKCKESEMLGLTSTRQHLNKKYPLNANVNIRLLDIMFSNICNLTCFMCSPQASSSISSERTTIKIIDKPVAYFDNTLPAIQAMDELPNLEKVDLIGGEFFLFKHNETILNKIIERKLACRLVTNATIITPGALHKLKQIKNLELEFSVDGSNECYEFMRYPASWATTSENIRTLRRELPHAKMKFVVIVQPLNIQHIVSSLEVLNQFMLPTHFQDMATPDYLSWPILTDDEKQTLVDHLENQMSGAKITNKQKTEIRGFIEGITKSVHNPELRQKSMSFLGKTLQHRNLNDVIITTQLGIFQNFSTQLLKDIHAKFRPNGS
jgi:sulfatase maturation enzyme AslB (radical SAM superfamily)